MPATAKPGDRTSLPAESTRQVPLTDSTGIDPSVWSLLRVKVIDDSPVVPVEEAEEVKSVGHSMALDRDITIRRDILKYLLQLFEMVGRRARRYGVAGKTVHFTIRNADFTTVGRKQTWNSVTFESLLDAEEKESSASCDHKFSPLTIFNALN